MRIAHIIDTLDFSGQSINMLKVAKLQQDQGHQVIVGGGFYRDFDNVETNLHFRNINDWAFWGKGGFESTAPKFANSDIIFYWGSEFEHRGVPVIEAMRKKMGLGLWKIPRVRVVGHIFDGAFSPRFLDDFDKFIFFTEAEKNMALFTPTQCTEVIGAGIDTKNIKVRPNRNIDAFTFGRLGYAGGKFHSQLIEVAGKIKKNKSIPKFKAILSGVEVGSFNHVWGRFDVDNLSKRIRDNDVEKEVEIDIMEGPLPVFDDIEKYYYKYDVFVATSSTNYFPNKKWTYRNYAKTVVQPLETFGTAALEAMACGIPVIVEQKGAMQEWIRHGIDGFVVNSEDEIVRYLEMLYNDTELYDKMSKAARSRAEYFELSKVVDAFNKVILDIKHGEYYKPFKQNVIKLRGHVPLDRYVTEEIIYADTYGIDKMTLPPDSTIVDVGGHIGSFSLRCTELFPDAKIHTFEPCPENFPLAQENLLLFENVTLYNGVVLGESFNLDKILLKNHQPEYNSGGWSVSHSGEGWDHEKQYVIPNKYVLAEQFDKIDLLKLDCEGSELKILSDMPDELLKSIKYITMEFHGNAVEWEHWEMSDLQAFKDRLLKYFDSPELEAGLKEIDRELVQFTLTNKNIK